MNDIHKIVNEECTLDPTQVSNNTLNYPIHSVRSDSDLIHQSSLNVKSFLQVLIYHYILRFLQLYLLSPLASRHSSCDLSFHLSGSDLLHSPCGFFSSAARSLRAPVATPCPIFGVQPRIPAATNLHPKTSTYGEPPSVFVVLLACSSELSLLPTARPLAPDARCLAPDTR